MANALSGSLNLGQSLQAAELAFGGTVSRKIPMKWKLAGKAQELWVGLGGMNGDVIYTSSSGQRRGYHYHLDLVSQWRIYVTKNFYAAFDLHIALLDQVNIFAKVNSEINEEQFTSTSHTQLTGSGFGLGGSLGYIFEFRFLGMKMTMGVAPFLRYNLNTYATRVDRVIVINQSTNAVDVSEEQVSGNFTWTTLYGGLTINFTI